MGAAEGSEQGGLKCPPPPAATLAKGNQLSLMLHKSLCGIHTALRMIRFVYFIFSAILFQLLPFLSQKPAVGRELPNRNAIT